MFLMSFFFFKQKTAYEVRISDWSSDVCSSDLGRPDDGDRRDVGRQGAMGAGTSRGRARFPCAGLLCCPARGTCRPLKFGIDGLLVDPDLRDSLDGKRDELSAHPASVSEERSDRQVRST